MFHRLVRAAMIALLACGAPSVASAQVIEAGKNEISTDFTFNSSMLSGVDSNRTTDYRWSLSYGRFLTDRFAVGPVFTIENSPNNDVRPFNIGGLGRFYFGDRDGQALPFVEVASTRAFNRVFDMNFTDVQVSGGVMFPMGRSGARFRVAPYYYRAFYDEQLFGISYSHAFGVSWSVALLF